MLSVNRVPKMKERGRRERTWNGCVRGWLGDAALAGEGRDVEPRKAAYL